MEVGHLGFKSCKVLSDLFKTCKSRNFLDWMSDLENTLKVESISRHLMSIAVANNVVIEHVRDYAAREIANTSLCKNNYLSVTLTFLTIIEVQQTLFRGNTTLTKTVELYMSWFGKPFLEASIGNVLRRLLTEKIAIEVDPMRSGKGAKAVERNVERLIYWCQEFWNQIYSVRSACPKFVCLVISCFNFINKMSSELRMLFETIRKLVEQRYRNDRVNHLNNKLRWQSVSAFCFLRFIVPAIYHPHLFGLYSGTSL